MQTNSQNGFGESASSVACNHSQRQSGASLPEPPQKKGKDKKIWSCHSCRRRKLKCDRSDPCGACQARDESRLCTWEEGQRPEKNNRESLEQLPNLILKLTEEVKELKLSNSEFMENIRYLEGAASMEVRPSTRSTKPAINPLVDFSYQSPDRKRWTQTRVDALLPESSLLRGLISQFIHASASLNGFIDVSQLVSEVEEIEQVRKGAGNSGPLISVVDIDIKMSLVLACASLAALNLEAAKAQDLDITHINIDSFARDLWKKARSLIAHLDSDVISTSFKPCTSALSRVQLSPTDTHTNSQQTESGPTSASTLLLRIVGIKIILLQAARSFAAPSEYLKLHLDTVSSAVEASLDSAWDNDVPLAEREWRWQLWSSLCVLDWNSPGIYHNGSYFIRPEMHSDPPSKVLGVLGDGTKSPIIEMGHLERLSQTRYFLEYALVLAHLSRRVEDCIIRPGPISPAQAAELCAELDALDHKLSFYQLLGGELGRGGRSGPKDSIRGRTSGEWRLNGSSRSHTFNEHQTSLSRALEVQDVHLRLELSLIRFKLFRHEAFHLMQDNTTSGPLRIMCMDACMDACILVLSQCRNIGMGVPHMDNVGVEGRRGTVTNLASEADGEQRHFSGIFRLVVQPASSAALVGQVLLHASQSADRFGLLVDKHINISRPALGAGTHSFTGSSSRSGSYPDFERSTESFTSRLSTNMDGGTSWAGRLEREKISILQWHVNTVMTELEALQSTSPLAGYKLALHRQCV